MRRTEYWVLPCWGDHSAPLTTHATHRQAERSARRFDRLDVAAGYTGDKRCIIAQVVRLERIPSKGRP